MTRSLCRLARLAFLLLAPMPAEAASGCPDIAQAPSSRWSIERDHAAFWLTTPCGERFFSLGVNVVDGGVVYGEGGRHYDWRRTDPSLPAWAERARRQLQGWGFNTSGGWSLGPELLKMPFLVNLELGRLARFHWFDPFAPETELRMRRLAERLVAPYRGNRLRIGYFSDNEVGWWRGTLFTFYIQEPPRSLTKQRLIERLVEHYRGDWKRFAEDFLPPPGIASFGELLVSEGEPVGLKPGGGGIGFVRRWTREVTERYYRLAAEAIRAADPEALFFGDRLPIYYDPEAVAAMAPWVDAIATNYNLDSPDGWLAHYFFDGLDALSAGRPFMVSEWFFAARENRSGNVNSGHLMTVATQKERAAGAAAATRRFARLPNLLGLHWFQYHDDPYGGRNDGEDYNFGLVDNDDHAYGELTQALSQANSELPALHAEAGRKAPHEFHGIPRAEIVVGDGVLTEWPKERALLPRLLSPPGEVPFGEAYLAWGAKGLSLAFIGMDYYDLQLLDYAGSFPRSESMRIDLGIDGGAGPRRFSLFAVPPRAAAGKGWIEMRVELCLWDGAVCRSVEGAETSYFGADQPRVTTELTIPWSAIGLAGPPSEPRLRLELAATAWYRSRWMSLSGLAPDRAMADSARWRELPLLP
ncbi:MAG: hypothetical protein HYR63_08250 [Proteobacteria bacterium]|nr:hypothetical protein [Pseudomonadota bacterium]MBI3497727.1 hypothetical protein [Pseudomonadota bacterium]